MAIQGLVDLQLTMFLMILTGLILKKLNIISEQGKESITNLVIYVLLPCNIIKSFMITFNKSTLISFGTILIISVLIQIMCFILSKILYVKYESEQRKVLQYATICSNAGFLGNPIAEGVFGAMGLAYASIFLIPQRIVMWSEGVATFTESPDKKTLIKRVLTHPCIVAVFIGLLFMFTQVHLPGFLDTSIKNLSNCSTALSMIVIGTILADVDFKTLVNKKLLYYTILRLVILPLLVWSGCIIFRTDALVTGVAVILTAMPAGTTTGILASKYNGDATFAAKCVILSTLASLVSTPIWSLILT
ncbi:AEC family transporter [Clostridium pasteurianum]|uniref:Putative permease n=1 Tax=Clostridium pasteurianum BC1 TaxID=86416 RepID=R4K822_CLOPA|nr:AEC family transporter [Clostridium pasteurianum]AGK96664.1 putative permease [Clostridium pasteurianum BC1]